MHCGLSERLVSFIEHVQETHDAENGMLRVLDLRLECRNQRLTEECDWASAELDLIEQEVIGYGDETEIAKLLSGEAQPTPVEANRWMNSPSAFAWT